MPQSVVVLAQALVVLAQALVGVLARSWWALE